MRQFNYTRLFYLHILLVFCFHTINYAQRIDSTQPPPTILPPDSVGMFSFIARWEHPKGIYTEGGTLIDVSLDSTFTTMLYSNIWSRKAICSKPLGWTELNRQIIGPLTPNFTFYYRIRSSIRAPRGFPGITTPFAVGHITTPKEASPLVPSLFPPHLITENSFAFAWQGDYASDISYGYRIEIAKDSSFSDIQQVVENFVLPLRPPMPLTADSTVTVKNLSPNTLYFCRVRAFNRAGTSAPSKTLIIKTLPKNAPFRATALPANYLSLATDWNKRRIYTGSTTLTIQGADSILIALEQRGVRVDSGFYSSRNYRCLDSTIKDISAFDVFINPQDSLKPMLDFVLGTSGYSINYPILGCQCSTTVRRYNRLEQTSVSTSNNGVPLFFLSPNPSTENVQLHFTMPTIARVRIDVLDMLGRTVLPPIYEEQSAGDHEKMLSAEKLTSGVYTVRLTMYTASGVQTETLRLVVAK